MAPPGVGRWPATREELVADQAAVARDWRADWTPPAGKFLAAGCFTCFDENDRAWAAAVAAAEAVVVEGVAAAAYEPGLLALREGTLLEAAVRSLPAAPQALLVDATGRDHPRRAGLALHLGAVLELPTAGVTHRPLVARGEWPPDDPGAASPLVLDDEIVGYWLRTRRGTRPLAVHAAWRTDAEAALAVVRACLGGFRTPEPIREARRVAREARAATRARR